MNSLLILITLIGTVWIGPTDADSYHIGWPFLIAAIYASLHGWKVYAHNYPPATVFTVSILWSIELSILSLFFYSVPNFIM